MPDNQQGPEPKKHALKGMELGSTELNKQLKNRDQAIDGMPVAQEDQAPVIEIVGRDDVVKSHKVAFKEDDALEREANIEIHIDSKRGLPILEMPIEDYA